MNHKPSQKSGRVLIPITKLAHLALAILVMSSCFYRETAPNVPHKSTLEPDDPGAAPSDQPLSVVFASPQGETTESPEISILFNRPMRTLDLSDAETPSPAILSPNTWGAWHWVGTQGLYFSPQTRLPLATEMVVSVPAGTSALDGTALSEPYVFRFNTARPSLVDVIPSDRASHLVPSSSFFLKFNQSIADSEIAQAIKITTSSEPVHSIPFAIMPRLLNKLNSARIVPTEPLPLAAKILITADESLRGMEGPLTAAKQAVFEYATIGPLRVVDYYCGINKQNKVCAPDSTVHIRLSNQVLTLEARQSLSVSPSTLLKEEKQYGEFPESVTDQIRIEGSFLPAKTYRFKIKGSLRDIYGQPMGKDEVVMVRFADLPSRVQIGVSLPYSSVDRIFMERGSIRDIPVTYTNAGDMELLTVRLAEDELGLLTDLDDIDFDRISTMSGVMPVHVEHPPDPNRTATHLIRPSDVLGGRDKRGPLLIAARYTSHGTYRNGEVDTDRRIVQVTDLGISTKISSYGSLVWITRLSDGKPVEGAEVRIRAAGGSASTDQVYRTDSNGIAIVDDAVLRVPAHGTVGPMIIAKHGQDWGYKAASDVQVSYYDDIPRVFGADVSPIGMVFTDRGIYGPGDTVKIKAILRDARSQDAVTLANKSTRVTVTGRRHKTLAIRDVKLSQFGTLALDFKVPENAALGKFNISVSVGGIDQSDASASFEVAEYRPSEFKVTTEFDRHLYIRGDTAKCTTHGRLLVGSPMGGARASMTVRRELVHFRVPNTVGFFTEDYYSNSQRAWSGNAVLDHLPLGKNKLDSGGDASLNTRLMLPGMVSTESIRCAAEVSDFSRQTVASSGMAIVHPAEFYLGIRQRSAAFPLAGETIEPGIVAVDYEGRRRSGVVATIQLVQHTFVPGNTVPGNADLWRYVTDVTTVVDHCTVHTSAVVESCKMTVPAAGFYSIRAKAVDRRGNPVLASTYIYTTGSGTPYSRSNFPRDDRLELVPDRDLYEVGDIANITVHSPFPDAEALVTVERDKIYSHRFVKLDGKTTTLQVPVTKDFDPNAYVSVLVIRGRTQVAPPLPTQWDPGKPEYQMAFATIKVSPEAKRLNLGISTGKTEFRPGEQVTVDLKVTDQAGKGQNAEVTLYAVDEGVLMLTKYQTPDPFPIFTVDQPLSVSYADTRHEWIHRRYGIPEHSEPAGRSLRTDFSQRAYYNPSIITDNAGNAKVTFKLPDNLTTYRIMAVAVGKTDRFGSSESTIRTSLPLLARAAFPMILRAGDELDAGVVVTSKSIPKSAIDVTASVAGAQLIGSATQRIELDTSHSQEVRFRFRANSVGNAKFKFHVKGGGKEDTLEFTRPVKSPAILETVALYGSTNTASGEKLGDLSGMRTDVGDLSISLSSTALVGLGANLESLTQYPCECSEQLASRLVPLVPLRALSKVYSIPIPESTGSYVKSTIMKLVRRQKRDGGFGFWDDSSASHPWVSAYVLWSLSFAKNGGIEVPDETIESGRKYLRKYLATGEDSDIALATSAFLVDVLAETGESDAVAMNRLYEKRTSMPLFSRALLAHAMSVGRGNVNSRDELIRDLETHVRIRGNSAQVVDNRGTAYQEIMDSTTRTNAMVLRALLSANKQHSLAPKMARGILSARKNGSWRNTQETAYALLALDDFRKSREAERSDFLATVWLGKDQLTQQLMAGVGISTFDLSVPASTVAKSGGSPLVFQLDGNATGTLHYEARLRFARKSLPSDQLDRGFAVLKSMRVVTPETLDKESASMPTMTGVLPTPRGGDLVLVDLLVAASQPSSYVIIDDPLPAGLEIVDSGLAITAGSSSLPVPPGCLTDYRDSDYPDSDFDRSDYETNAAYSITGNGTLQTSPFGKEFRDDRALFFVEKMAVGMYHFRYLARATTIGRFVMPPTRVESMYQPEVYGRTGAAVVRVVP